MTTRQKLAAGYQKIIDRAGIQIRVQYFTQVVDDVYDDADYLVQSGTDLWTSGVVFPLSNRPGHSDSILLEQGKLIHTDTKLYLHGSLLLTGSELNVKVSVGSPINSDTNYSIIPPGAVSYSVSNVPIYKVVYIRKIGGTGSFANEV